MKAQELIEKLKELIDINKDLPVIFFDGTTREYTEVEVITFYEDHIELE